MRLFVLILCVMLSAAALPGAAPAAAQVPPPAPTPAPEPRPVTLAQALTQALQNNLAIRLAGFEVQITRAQLEAAQRAKAGTVRSVVSYTRTNEQAPVTIVIPAGTFGPGVPPTDILVTLPPTPPNLFDARIIYEYPIYTGGRLEAQIALAGAGVRGAEAALERTKQEIILQTKLAYFQVLGTQAGVEAAQRGVAQAEETLRIARARVQAGTSPRFDEIQAEVSLAQAQQTLGRARNGVAVATQGLAAVVGLPVDSSLRPQEQMEVAPVRAPVAELLARGFSQRPEIAEHKARADAAQAAIELARAGAQPVVGLVGTVNTTGTSFGSIGLGWSVMLSATFPLFDGGVTAAKIKEAELRLEALKVVEMQLRQRIELEVRQAALNLAAAAEEVAAATKTIEAAREALRIAQVRFREGVGTNLEVIAAQAALAQSEAARVQALLAFNTARAQLERAAGGPV